MIGIMIIGSVTTYATLRCACALNDSWSGPSESRMKEYTQSIREKLIGIDSSTATQHSCDQGPDEIDIDMDCTKYQAHS